MKTTKPTKKTRNRTMRVDLRLTKSEKTMFFEKAGDAFDGNVTQMVVYAVSMLDENLLGRKQELIGKFSESFKKKSRSMRLSRTALTSISFRASNSTTMLCCKWKRVSPRL